ncbi:hypothetical protein DKT69_11490 [Micromonospora sicca]|uniref:Uncharacterized protein n=1 Tax=Micromonospora sicca TaxID=2202420 RepID=A0A317DLX6_9ACTN|nr:hypothetical protein DKT69_11490 [Micromonospora sp. 4G51]
MRRSASLAGGSKETRSICFPAQPPVFVATREYRSALRKVWRVFETRRARESATIAWSLAMSASSPSIMSARSLSCLASVPACCAKP